jgi:hypothetical protein
MKGLFWFICGLFNDPVSGFDYTTSNDRMDYLGRISKDVHKKFHEKLSSHSPVIKCLSADIIREEVRLGYAGVRMRRGSTLGIHHVGVSIVGN